MGIQEKRMEFDHIGVPTSEPKEGEVWIEATRVWVTEARKHPYRIEWLRYADDSPVPAFMKTTAHVAYKVADLEAALRGKNVVLGPFTSDLDDTVAFIRTDDGAVVEFMQTGREG